MAEWTYLTNELPGDAGSLRSAVKYVLGRAMLDMQCCLPARIVSYDRELNVATVQPLIMYTSVEGKTTSRTQLSGIPILSLGGGGFHISFPIKTGDLLWIVASDRDITSYMESLDEQPAPLSRCHSFSDCWGIPDVMRKYTIKAEEQEAMVIQSTDAATRIAVFDDHIVVTAPSNILFDTPLSTFTGNVHILGETTIEQTTVVNANTTINGNTSINGGFQQVGGAGSGAATFGGAVTAVGEITSGSVTLTGHVHVSNGTGQDTSKGRG